MRADRYLAPLLKQANCRSPIVAWRISTKVTPITTFDDPNSWITRGIEYRDGHCGLADGRTFARAEELFEYWQEETAAEGALFEQEGAAK